MPDNSLNWSAPGPFAGTSMLGYEDMSCKSDGTNIYFNSPADLTIPQRRFGMVTQYVGGTAQQNLPSQQYPFTAVATTDASYGGVPIASDGTYPIWATSPASNTYDQVYKSITYSKATSDVVIADVLSFDVRFLRPGDPEFVDLTGMTMNNTTFGSSGLTINGNANTAVKVFDTWSQTKDGTYDYSGWNGTTATSTTVPLQAQILAIKVTIRIWDFKTEQARQASIVVAM
jgi:hypothetical protein